MSNPAKPHEIDNGRHWIGQTNREIRDKIEQGSMEIERLRGEIDRSSTKLSSTLQGLTTSIVKISDDSAILAKRSLLLSIVVGAATITMAIIAAIQFCGEIQKANVQKADNIQAIKVVLMDMMQASSVSATKHMKEPVTQADILEYAQQFRQRLMTLSGNPILFRNERALKIWGDAISKTRAAEAVFFSDNPPNIIPPVKASELIYSASTDIARLWSELIGGPEIINMKDEADHK